MIKLHVDSEDEPILGRDYFGVHRTERLVDTGAVIARIVRGKERIRKIVVNAAESGGFELADLSVSEPSLETVFISLTGKDLRE